MREKSKQKQKKDENVGLQLASAVPPLAASRSSPRTTKRSLGKKEQVPWKDFQVATAEANRIERRTGAQASPFDTDDPVDDANGYQFVAIDKLRSRVDEYGDAHGPIAFITPSQTDAEMQLVKATLSKEWPGKVLPTARRQTRLHDKIESRVVTKSVTIFNINPDNIIDAVLKLVPALTMQANPRMQLSVAIHEPICYDLGLENWWKSVKSISAFQIKATIIKLIQIPSKSWKPQESQVHVRRDRMLKWRNEALPEGSALTAVDVPNEYVRDVLSISGKRCIIIDFTGGETKAEYDKEFVNVCLPLECNAK